MDPERLVPVALAACMAWTPNSCNCGGEEAAKAVKWHDVSGFERYEVSFEFPGECELEFHEHEIDVPIPMLETVGLLRCVLTMEGVRYEAGISNLNVDIVDEYGKGNSLRAFFDYLTGSDDPTMESDAEIEFGGRDGRRFVLAKGDREVELRYVYSGHDCFYYAFVEYPAGKRPEDADRLFDGYVIDETACVPREEDLLKEEDLPDWMKKPVDE